MPTFSFGCNRNLIQKAKKSTPYPATKDNPNIRESISDFVAPIGEIITDMPYLCEAEVSEQREQKQNKIHLLQAFNNFFMIQEKLFYASGYSREARKDQADCAAIRKP